MNDKITQNDLISKIHQLLTSCFHALLSTHSVKFPGYPFGSLLPLCRDQKGHPILLISHLAQHTRNLVSNPLCSLTLSESIKGDIQQLSRLTCLGSAQPLSSTSAAERYFRYFPEGRHYHEELHFDFYRLNIEQYYFIGGFGAVRWFEQSGISSPTPFSTPDETELLFRLNGNDHKMLHRYMSHCGISTDASVIEAVGADPHGLDIRYEQHLQRVPFPHPLSSNAGLDDIVHFFDELLS
jgi:putative heme iron utilization protein